MSNEASLRDIARRAHATAKEKGWYDGDERTPLEIHALIHSEVSEATEEVRKGRLLPIYQQHPTGWMVSPDDANIGDGYEWDYTVKPEGELVELADVIIRICDYAESRGWDIQDAVMRKMRFNETRPYRHGGKTK